MSESQEQAKLYLEQQLSSSYPGMSINQEGSDGLSLEIVKDEIYIHIDAKELNSAIENGQTMTGVVCNAGGAGLVDNNPTVSSISENGELGSQITLCCSADTNGFEILHDVVDKIDVGISNWNGIGFSDGAAGIVYAADAFLQEHPACAKDFKLYLADGAWTQPEQFQNHEALERHKDDIEMYFTIANSEDPYYNAREGYWLLGTKAEKRFRDIGFNTHIIQSNEKYKSGETHSALGKLTISLVLSENKNVSRVTFMSYDPSEDDYVEDSLLAKNSIFGDAFSINIKNKDLEEMKKKSVLDSTILSNTILSMQHINSISNEMNNNSGLFAPSTQNIGSTASIASGIVSAQNAYLSISNDLHHRARLELGLITDITQRYYDMDGDLSSLASNLQTSGVNDSYIAGEVYTNLTELLHINNESLVQFYKNYQVPTFTNVQSIGTINKAEILALADSNGAVMQNLQADMDSARRTKQAFEDFENDIGVHFKGDAWNAVKGNLSLLAATEGIRINSCEALMTAISEASKLIADYMGDDTDLDTSQIPVLTSLISSLQSELDAMITITKWDMWEKEYYSYQVPKLQGSQRSEAQAALEQAQAALNKLNGLGPIIQAATNIVNNALQEVYTDFGVVVDGLSLGKVEPYVPKFTQGVSSGVSTSQVPISTMPTVPTMKYSPTNNKAGTIVDVDPNAVEVTDLSDINVGSAGGGGLYSYGGGGGGFSQLSQEQTEVPEIPDEEDDELIEEEEEQINAEEEQEEVLKEDEIESNEEKKKETQEEKENSIDEEELIAVKRPTISNLGSSTSSKYNIPSAYNQNKDTSSLVGTPIIDENTLDGVIDEPLEDIIIDDYLEELPIEEDIFLEEPIIEEPEFEQPIQELSSDITKVNNKNGTTAKTIATLVGVGASVGAASYGAHKYIKSKEENDEYESYSEEEEY